MTAIHRNNATGDGDLVKARLDADGSDAMPDGPAPTGKVTRRWRHPDDPAAEWMPAAEFLGHETDIGAILEECRDAPGEPARRRGRGRLMGMFAMYYQGARRQERRFLRMLLGDRWGIDWNRLCRRVSNGSF